MKLKFLSLYPVLSLLYGQFSFAMPDDFYQWNSRMQPKAEVSNETVYANTLVDNSPSNSDCNNDVTISGSIVERKASCRHSNVVKWIVEQGVNAGTMSRNGYPSMYVAVLYGNIDIVKYLIDHDVDVNTSTNAGLTPLMVASRRGSSEIVKLLIKNGANVNAYDKDGVTPLMSAALYGHFGIVEYLVNNGADINIRARDGSTAPQLAALSRHWEIVDFLSRRILHRWEIVPSFGISLPVAD